MTFYWQINLNLKIPYVFFLFLNYKIASEQTVAGTFIKALLIDRW